MRTLLEPSVRSRVLKIVASASAVLLFAGGALAGPVKIIEARATGQVGPPVACSETDPVICQETHVSGTATVLGRFDGVLSDRVNFLTGAFTGNGVFTTPDGSTLTTTYAGQLGATLNGVTPFIEYHTVIGGTGKFDGLTGAMTVTGTVDGAGHIEIVGTGMLTK